MWNKMPVRTSRVLVSTAQRKITITNAYQMQWTSISWPQGLQRDHPRPNLLLSYFGKSGARCIYGSCDLIQSIQQDSTGWVQTQPSKVSTTTCLCSFIVYAPHKCVSWEIHVHGVYISNSRIHSEVNAMGTLEDCVGIIENIKQSKVSSLLKL